MTNGTAYIKWLGAIAVSVMAVASGWQFFKASIIREVSAQHQEDVMAITERFICWNESNDSVQEYMICRDKYQRFRIQRRIERDTQSGL